MISKCIERLRSMLVYNQRHRIWWTVTVVICGSGEYKLGRNLSVQMMREWTGEGRALYRVKL
jgi:hypothetical protein